MAQNLRAAGPKFTDSLFTCINQIAHNKLRLDKATVSLQISDVVDCTLIARGICSGRAGNYNGGSREAAGTG